MVLGAHDSGSAFRGLLGDVHRCVSCPGMAHTHALGAANGGLRARALFVAEAPGRRGAAVTGVPLTRDESGRRFAAFLAIAGVHRGDVFVTNAVLCNPLDAAGRNRRPSAAETARCRPLLARTLDVVRAPVVVALGRVALESLRAVLPHDAQLPRDAAAATDWCGRELVAMYHPSRQSTLHRAQAQQENDWRRLGALIRDAAPGPRLLRAKGATYHERAL